MDEVKYYLERIQNNRIYEEYRKVIIPPMMFCTSIEEIEKFLKENKYEYEIGENEIYGKYAIVYIKEVIEHV